MPGLLPAVRGVLWRGGAHPDADHLLQHLRQVHEVVRPGAAGERAAAARARDGRGGLARLQQQQQERVAAELDAAAAECAREWRRQRGPDRGAEEEAGRWRECGEWWGCGEWGEGSARVTPSAQEGDKYRGFDRRFVHAFFFGSLLLFGI